MKKVHRFLLNACAENASFKNSVLSVRARSARFYLGRKTSVYVWIFQ